MADNPKTSETEMTEDFFDSFSPDFQQALAYLKKDNEFKDLLKELSTANITSNKESFYPLLHNLVRNKRQKQAEELANRLGLTPEEKKRETTGLLSYLVRSRPAEDREEKVAV